MKQLVINDLYLFSVREKRAKHIVFKKGINVITSNKETGTKKGKSVVLKSVYHTLGADCYFEDQWNENDKVYILDFTIDGSNYRMFRQQRLFKLFDLDRALELFRTVHRDELASFLKEIFGFSVELPNKQSGELEIAPPAYNYLLSFIDQDKIDGSNFTSFKSLAQYSDFKDKVLYYHFNVYNSEYYRIVKEMEKIERECSELEHESELNQKVLSKINKAINNADYSKNMDNLQREIELTKEEYKSIAAKLNKSKKTLIDLRNKKEDLEHEIIEVNLFSKSMSQDIKKIVNHECPLCHNFLDDSIDTRIEKYSTIEDLLYLKAEMEAALNELEHRITKEEEKYKAQLEVLEKYEDKLKINTDEVSDILKHKGYMEIREGIVKELGNAVSEIGKGKDDLKELKKKKDVYDNSKKSVNSKYYEWMLKDKNYFGLKEIDDKKLENVCSIINAGGSNRPIATAIWYLNLIKLKKQFNPDAIRFPVVLDSPNNVETDDEKRQKLLEYIFKSCKTDEQLIVSTLGFDKNEFVDIEFANVIELTNEKYQLLSEKEFEEFKDIFVMTMDEEIE